MRTLLKKVDWGVGFLVQFCAHKSHTKIGREYITIKHWLRCRNILHIQISDVHTIIEGSWKWSAFCLLLKCLLRIKKHKKVYFKDKSKFHQIERNKEVRLAKSCKECNLKKYEEKKRALELEYQHIWIREDGSKITDP